MQAKLDLTNATLVVAGQWNDAILTEPGWLARHILGVPEGQELQLETVIIGNQVAPGQLAPQKQIWLFEKFGISCSDQRLELYSRDIDDCQAMYEAIGSIAEKLPHTPVKAIGVNFMFQLSGDLAATVPLLETKETFDALGAIRAQERTDSIQLANESLFEIADTGKIQTILKLSRKTDFEAAEVRFNYHMRLDSLELLPKWAEAKPILHWWEHAIEVMKNTYGPEEFAAEYL